MLKYKISTFIACRNHGKFLEEAAESCLRQSFQPSQLILINDQSEDNSLAVMEKIKAQWNRDNCEVVIRDLNPRLGHIHSYNLGLKLSSGNFIHLMSADDLINNKMFYERAVLMMTDRQQSRSVDFVHDQPMKVFNGDMGKIGFVTTSVRHIDDSGKWLHEMGENGWPSMWETVLAPREALHELSRRGNFVPGAAVLARKECYDAVPPYSVEHPYAADWLMWVRMLRAGWHLGILKGAMFSYRHHAGQMTAVKSAPRSEREGIYKELVTSLRELSSAA